MTSKDFSIRHENTKKKTDRFVAVWYDMLFECMIIVFYFKI